ncbi:hypothetical protein HZC30_02535 [Candidatus Woesearchaeota archaeon]|nr:hypothetical protein [Candidatus Woesearchaeota archaeon]
MISRVTLELPTAQRGDFREFLHRHQRVESFQETDGCFMVRVVPRNSQEYHAFVRGIKEAFQVDTIKETTLCPSLCRDGTNCLNRAKYGEYCWRHTGGYGEKTIFRGINYETFKI